MDKLNVLFKWILRKSVVFSAALIIIACVDKTPDQSAEKIIARIGDKTISVDEFVSRAEMTIRPEYCRGENDIHKRIILNSLIAEKLLALEAGDKNELTQDEQFGLHLKGRKEQAMRQWLYYHDFYKKVKLDTNEIKMAFKLTSRIYEIAYFTMKDSSVAKHVQKKLNQGLSFTEIFQQLEGIKEIPRREVSWNAPEHETIHTALFSERLCKDQVIGPVKIENNFYLMIKILGWIEQKVFSDSEIRKRLDDVKKKLKKKQASVQFREYIHGIMANKKVDFAKDTFYKLVNILGSVYMKTKNAGISTFNQRFWDIDSNKINIDDLEINIKKIQDLSLLHIDNEIWTVGDLKKEMILHPLVFRKNRFSKSEFAEQLKLAIVDMIRDKYLTKEAYKMGYHEVAKVQRDGSMWYDYYNSVYQKYKFLESLGKSKYFDKEDLHIIEQDLNPYIHQLQQKYKEIIEIDFELIEDVKLTAVDLFVVKKNVPFPAVVPPFPFLTTDHQLPF